MKKKEHRPDPTHTWFVMWRASYSIVRYLSPPILQAGLGDSDFRVLEVLLHKGPTPVNAIGPKVNLNPGSVSVAVDRLYKKGLVSRVESELDRRVRTVSLTEKGRELFVPLFRQIAALVKRVFQDVSLEEQKQFEDVLKRIGKRAGALALEEIGSIDRKDG
jgi:MarR family transcriptional regulator, 2-MHQ and catechol-resistance regulon repressor